MSDHEDDLELQALQRKLDDAFETTRPRAGFEDELWVRVQSSRPAPRRLRDALAAFWQGVREVPAVPASAIALVLIVALGVGIYTLSGARIGGGGATSGAQNASAPYAGSGAADSFGRLPSPVFAGSAGPPQTSVQPNSAAIAVHYTWAGTFTLNITTAPVFRYNEPTRTDADQFASALGAVLRERPSGFLGSYSAADYTLKVRGTLPSPQASPAYFIFSGLNLPPVDAAGGPEQLADVFLAQHSLAPQWPYTVTVDTSGDPTKVIYERQFPVPGYGPAYLLDFNGNRYGAEVDLNGNRPVVASGMLPVGMDVADYRVIGAADAIAAATGAPGQPVASGAPTVQLNHAELVYVLVTAGDHSFYEPAFLFTGTQQAGGQSLARQVLVAAVDPSQRSH
jgi:hypothetical protein